MTFDHILFWNKVAMEANRMAHSGLPDPLVMGPVGSSRAFAIVHLAMHDAYRGATGESTYLPPPSQPQPGTSRQMAAGAAAHRVLTELYPSQAGVLAQRLLEANVNLLLNGVTGTVEGMAYGIQVADALLMERTGDPTADDNGYLPSNAPGRHRPDPHTAGLDTAPSGPDIDYHGPFYGSAPLFAVNSVPSLDPPPMLKSAEYVAALRRVRSKGIAPELGANVPAAERRTPEETLIGIYWGYDGATGLGTPPRLYNQIIREVSALQGTGEADNAVLFALVNAAIGDAGILAWKEKYLHDFWRPILGIREHDSSMGPTGAADTAFSQDCDPGWLPMGAPATNSVGKKNFTPPFPAYPSGHATFGAAALGIARRFYGVTTQGPDTLFPSPHTFVSDEYNGFSQDNQGTLRPRHTRSFPGGLWQMIEENGRSREFLGVHWIFDAFAEDANGSMDVSQNVGGVPLGLAIAEDIWEHFKMNGEKLLHP